MKKVIRVVFYVAATVAAIALWPITLMACAGYGLARLFIHAFDEEGEDK